jgi:H+/Cl- antiporter ClcA
MQTVGGEVNDEVMPPAAGDPMEVVRSAAYRRLLVLAGVVGVPTAVVAYAFLAAVDGLQELVYDDLPTALGFETVPVWWPVPLLALSGLLVALCITSLPGNCGHSPADGFQSGGVTRPAELPGVILAALATLSLGAVLGPEAPLIALGSGLGALALTSIQRDAPATAVGIIAAAGSFAAVSALIGSPLFAALLILEIAGLAGPMVAVSLLPGLLAAGIGFLVFIGLDSFTGLGRFSLALPDLPEFSTPTVAMFAWAFAFGLVCPLLGWGISTLAQTLRPAVHARRRIVTPLLGVGVGLSAVVFAEITGEGVENVLFSGQAQLPALIEDAPAWSVGTLVVLIACKSVAYALSLSAFRGGPVFPSLFIGAAIGVAAADLPGLSLVPALGMAVAAMSMSMLKLPFTSVMLVALLLSSDSYAVLPLAIVSVAVAFLVGAWLPAPRALVR